MSATFDDKDLRDMAKHLKSAPEEVRNDVVKLLDKHAKNAAREARAAAPKDRPWLSTTKGLQVRRPAALVRRIVSPLDPAGQTPLDPEGQSVGYRIEYGTSVITPRPFLGPAIRKARDDFLRDALDVLAKRTI